MREKVSLVFHLIAIFLLLPQTNCFSKTSRKVSECAQFKFKYEKFHVNFYFSSRKKRNTLYDPDTKFKPEKIDFDPRRRTTVLLHGFLGTSRHMQALSDSLIKWQDSNVINVEWKEGCSNVFAYPQTVVNTEYTAIQIKRLFKKLINNKWKNMDHWGPIHLIGHSLGAHLAGQAADLLKLEHNITVDRITGLDPAGPCFDDPDSPLRLKKTNAKFVDIVHTDATTNFEQTFGLRDSIGHVDFYINGGNKQPGCDKERRKRTVNFFGLAMHAVSNGECNHHRALTLFTETVKQASSYGCQYWARPWKLNSKPAETKRILREQCISCVEMGILAENHQFTSNIYYLATTGRPPYCTN